MKSFSRKITYLFVCALSLQLVARDPHATMCVEICIPAESTKSLQGSEVESLLVKQKSICTLSGEEQQKLLHEAGKGYNVYMLQKLAEEGVDLTLYDNEDHTILTGYIATKTSIDFGYVKNLVELEPKLLNKVDNRYGKTPLMHALEKSDFAFALYLCDLGADVTLKNTLNNRTALDYAYSSGYNSAVEFVKLCLQAGVSLGYIDLGEVRHPEIMKLLLEAGMDPNTRSRYGYRRSTALHVCKDLKIAEVLIAHGADVNARDHRGNTPLMRQLESSWWSFYPGIPQLLIDKGASLAAVNYAGKKLMDCVDSQMAYNFLRQNGVPGSMTKWVSLHKDDIAGVAFFAACAVGGVYFGLNAESITNSFEHSLSSSFTAVKNFSDKAVHLATPYAQAVLAGAKNLAGRVSLAKDVSIGQVQEIDTTTAEGAQFCLDRVGEFLGASANNGA